MLAVECLQSVSSDMICRAMRLTISQIYRTDPTKMMKEKDGMDERLLQPDDPEDFACSSNHV